MMLWPQTMVIYTYGAWQWQITGNLCAKYIYVYASLTCFPLNFMNEKKCWKDRKIWVWKYMYMSANKLKFACNWTNGYTAWWGPSDVISTPPSFLPNFIFWWSCNNIIVNKNVNAYQILICIVIYFMVNSGPRTTIKQQKEVIMIICR